MKCHDFEWMTLALNRKLSAWILLSIFYFIQEWNPLLSIHSFNYLKMCKNTKYTVTRFQLRYDNQYFTLHLYSHTTNIPTKNVAAELILPNNSSIIFSLQS